MIIIRLSQESDLDLKLLPKALDPFKDKHGILRVGLGLETQLCRLN